MGNGQLWNQTCEFCMVKTLSGFGEIRGDKEHGGGGGGGYENGKQIRALRFQLVQFQLLLLLLLFSLTPGLHRIQLTTVLSP